MNYTLYQTITHFLTEFIKIAFGILSVVLALWLALGTALDLLYITNPLVHDKFEKYVDGNRKGGFSLISNNAITAVEDAAVLNQNASYLYMKRRLKTYIIGAVIEYFLLTGAYIKIALFIWKVISPIFKTIGALTD